MAAPSGDEFWDAFMVRGVPTGRPVVQSRARLFMEKAKNPRHTGTRAQYRQDAQANATYANPGTGQNGETSN
jgi:hypothetical protein